MSDLSQLSMPFAPGQRELTFTLDQVNGTGIEVIVYYSTTNDFSHKETLPHGRAVIIVDGKPQHFNCRFIFPHIFFKSRLNADLNPAGPNARLFQILDARHEPGLVHVDDPSLLDESPLEIKKDSCVYFQIFKNETVNGIVRTSYSTVHQFTMPDLYNIGLTGDSYAAGEGAPSNTQGNNDEERWDEDCMCHRSTNSGFVRGTMLFIDNNPDIGVNFAHVACTAATIDGLIGCQGMEYPTTGHSCQTTADEKCIPGDLGSRIAQFDALKSGQRFADLDQANNMDQVNMVIISIGGNNVHFAGFVVNYVLLPFSATWPLPCRPNSMKVGTQVIPCGQDLINDSHTIIDAHTPSTDSDLERGYSNINSNLENQINNATHRRFTKPIPIVSTYPDPTTGQGGERCGCDHGWLEGVVIATAMAIGANATNIFAAIALGPVGFVMLFPEIVLAEAAAALAVGVATNATLHFLRYGLLAYENSCLWSPREEWQLIEDQFIIPLNKRIRELAQEFKWDTIDAEHLFDGRGLCDRDDPMENGICSSVSNQGNPYGLVHPNSRGYSLYMAPVANAINRNYLKYLQTYAMALLSGCISRQNCIDPEESRRSVMSFLLNNLNNSQASYSFLHDFLESQRNSILPTLKNSSISSISLSPYYDSLLLAISNNKVCDTGANEIAKSVIPRNEVGPAPAPFKEGESAAYKNLQGVVDTFMSTKNYNDLVQRARAEYSKLPPTDPIRRNAEYVDPLDRKYHYPRH